MTTTKKRGLSLLWALFRKVRLFAPLPTGQTPRTRRVDGYTPSEFDTQALIDATFKRERKNAKRAAQQ